MRGQWKRTASCAGGVGALNSRQNQGLAAGNILPELLAVSQVSGRGRGQSVGAGHRVGEVEVRVGREPGVTDQEASPIVIARRTGLERAAETLGDTGGSER